MERRTGNHQMNWLPWVVVEIIMLGGISVPWARAAQLSFVLTGNATGQEVGMDLECSYTANPPYTNPADPTGRRLIDRDRPYADWNTTAGINHKDQNVTFDLKADCRIDAVALLFDRPQKPAFVEVFIADSTDGPWREVGTLNKEAQTDPWWRLELSNTNGRYVRLFHKLDKWGWYLREVKIYGNISTGRVGPTKRNDSSLILIDQGKALATIIVADEPRRNALEAATALQRHVHQMTGVWLAIKKESEFKGPSARVFVGMSELARKCGVVVKQDLLAGDHYVIRTGEDFVALVGNDIHWDKDRELRGSAYAVYDLLQRLGCGWFAPDPVWHVIPKIKTLKVPPIDVSERPAFAMRHIWLVKDRVMRDAWRLGGQKVSCDHVLKRLPSREKYQKDHPEYFGKLQPCLTHPDVIEIIAKSFGEQIDKRGGVVSFSLSAADGGGWCECENCRAVGNISARMLNFANEIARKLAKTHPNRYLLTFLAYWYSHAPPKPVIKAEPGVCVMMVNEGNHVQPWDKPEPPELARTTGRNNTREVNAFEGWRQTGATMAIYEWWIPGCSNKNWRSVPWYSGETALRNLRYWQRGGVRYITYETQYENGNGFPIRWPLFYVGARGLWNPKLTARQIMTEACDKLYGPAAQHMLKFYQVIEQAMADSTEHGGNWNLPSPEKIYTMEIEARATKHLETASAATTAPEIAARIDQERKMWDTAKKVMAKLRSARKPAFAVVVDGKSMIWNKGKIEVAAIRSLHGIPAGVALFALETDGQKRRAKQGEVFDLTTKVKFVTKR